MTKLLVLVVGVLLVSRRAHADQTVIVVAVNLSKPVNSQAPDGKTDFQKDVDGVARLLAQTPANCYVKILGITDHSFTQPYILLSAKIPGDMGYFGERLSSARAELVRAWKLRSEHLEPKFRQTDILGALLLASQIFAQQPNSGRKMLFVFSDMRHRTPDLNLEAPGSLAQIPPRTEALRFYPDLHGIQVYAIGVDGTGASTSYWQQLHDFRSDFFAKSGSKLKRYSVLCEIPGLEIQ